MISQATPSQVQSKVDYKLVPFGGGVAPDAKVVTALHMELLPKSPLVKMGERFMREFYYPVLP